MIPEKYRKEKRFNKLKGSSYLLLFIIIFFLSGYLVLGPLVHEVAHMIFLKVHGCNFYSRYSFSFFSGLTGVFELNCSLNQVQESLFFLIGYFTTLLTGILTLLVSRKSDRFEKYLLSIGLGMLISTFSSISMKGDIHSVPEIQGIGILLVTLAIFILVSGSTVLALEPHISEWEERD